MSKDLNRRSSELICWLTADWVTWLICAALVKLSVSARSQKTFRLSICMVALKAKSREALTSAVSGLAQRKHAFDSPQQVLAGEWLAQIILVLGIFGRRPQVTAGAQNRHSRRHPANVIDQLPPTHPGHDKVGDDEINLRARLGEQLQRPRRAVGGQNLVAKRRENDLSECQHRLVVVHEQDRLRPAQVFSLGRVIADNFLLSRQENA